jgi:hypothetical protein
MPGRRSRCVRPAVIQIECRDAIGHPFWNRDYCETHAKPIIVKAERLKIPCPGPTEVRVDLMVVPFL